MENKMFCYQCQETAGCTGCTQSGVCGKKPDVANMQDLLIYVTKGYSQVADRLRQEGGQLTPKDNRVVTMNLFMTITNANFDLDVLTHRVTFTMAARNELRSRLKAAAGLHDAAT